MMKRSIRERVSSWLVLLVMASLVGLVPSAADAQVAIHSPLLPGAGSVESRHASHAVTHSWMIVRDGENLALIHLPPRTHGESSAGGALAASGGSVRRVIGLEELPAALAAVDERLYLVFETRDRGGRVSRRDVRSVAAIRSGLGALWRFEPPSELNIHPSLPPGGTLIGVAPVGRTIAAVRTDAGEANPGEPAILVLHQERWLSAPLPDDMLAALAGSAGPPRMVAMRQGAGLAIPMSRGELALWIGRVEIPRAVSPAYRDDEHDGPLVPLAGAEAEGGGVERFKEPTPIWTWSVRRFKVDPAVVHLAGAGSLIECGGAMVWLEPEAGGEVRLTEISDRGTSPIARIDGVTLPVSAASLDGDGRIALIWSEVVEPLGQDLTLKPSSPTRRSRVVEVSPHTGRVLYSGEAKSLGPISPTDLRLLSTALLLTMGVVLLLVLRPDPSDGVVTIPEGFALAESGRRVVAGIADAVMAVWISSVLWGIDFAQVLSPEGMIGGETWVVLGSAIGIGLVMCTVGEWRTGRSPGKLLTGCEVISVASLKPPVLDGAPARPTLWRALERNALKWLLPPIAMLGLFDEQGRHRADMMARTLVVIRLEADEESE